VCVCACARACVYVCEHACIYGGVAALNLQGSSAHIGVNFVGAKLF
jgi:hypothetical protein